ncbi:MAG: SRPBCC family protein [Pseudomonadota bacterium]
MTLTTIAALGGLAVLALAATPFALPDSRTVERSAIIEAAPETLFPLLASSEGFQTFNPYKDTDPDLSITFSGPRTGVGAAFAFEGKEGRGTQTITALEENRSVTMQIDLGAMGQPLQTFTLEPQADGTRIVWSVESQFGMNPIGRVFGLFLDGMLGPVYERGLDNLANVAADNA